MCSCSKQSQISTGNDIQKLQSDQQETVFDTIQDARTPTLRVLHPGMVTRSRLRKDIDCLENVQRTATKMVAGLKNLSYVQRLERLNLSTMEERRGLNRNVQIVNRKGKCGLPGIGNSSRRRTISTGCEVICKVLIPSVRTTLRKSFFSHRVLDRWNRLPETVVDADRPTVQTLYDRFSQGRI